MYEVASYYNISNDEFWSMTVHELNLMIKAKAQRNKDDLLVQTKLSYLNASNPHFKEPLSYEDYLKEMGFSDDKSKKEMSTDEMKDVVKHLNTIFGGNVT